MLYKGFFIMLDRNGKFKVKRLSLGDVVLCGTFNNIDSAKKYIETRKGN